MNENDCIICYQPSKCKMPCCVAFCHRACLELWLQAANRCPHCQKQILTKIQEYPNLINIAFDLTISIFMWLAPTYLKLLFVMRFLIEYPVSSLNNNQLDSIFEDWIENKPILREYEIILVSNLQNFGIRLIVGIMSWYFPLFGLVCLFISMIRYSNTASKTRWFYEHKVIDLTNQTF